MTDTSDSFDLPKKLPSKQPVNVLLVDDQPANLLALDAILDDLGYNLVKAHSGTEALCRCQGDDFAVVLLDVQMHGLDGFETAKLIRGRGHAAALVSHVSIIFPFLLGVGSGLVLFSQLVVEQRFIREIDVNPLVVSPEGIVALDARVLLYERDFPEGNPEESRNFGHGRKEYTEFDE